MMKHHLVINFTKSRLLDLQHDPNRPSTSNQFYYDSVFKGLALWVGKGGSKVFCLCKKVNHKQYRLRLGHFPEMTVEQARIAAMKEMARLKTETPVASTVRTSSVQYSTELPTITLNGLFDLYLERHAKLRKKTWAEDIKDFDRHFRKWGNRPVLSLQRHECANWHAEVTRKRGPYEANRAGALLRCIFNRGIDYGYLDKNPMARFRANREKSRERFLHPDELKRFLQAVNQLPYPQYIVFFKLLLLTGARKSNLLTMQWKDIDFDNKVWRIPITKNGSPQWVPLVTQAFELLQNWKQAGNDYSFWVFPSQVNPLKHMVYVERIWRGLLQETKLEDLRMHDLRRSLASYQVMTGASPYVIAQSLGHKSLAATAVYARMNLDTVRQAMEKAAVMMDSQLIPATNVPESSTLG
jgi:integrase